MPKRVIATDRLMQPIAHFSHAARIGNAIYVGATAGTDAGRRLAGSRVGGIDFAAQTRQMFDNAETVLGLLGARLEDTVRIKTYLADLRDLVAYRGLFGARFAACRPSHAVAGSWGFPLPQAAVEFDLVAVVDEPRERPESARLPAAAAACAPAGVRVGARFYCTALPVDRSGNASPGNPAAQSELALANLSLMLEAAGLRPADVVNAHVTLSHAGDFAALDSAYRDVFRAPYPSRTLVVAPLESEETLVQIEATAFEGGGRPISGPGEPTGLGAASAACLAEDECYVSGHTGWGGAGEGQFGVEGQTRAAWERISALLQAAGMDRSCVLRTNNVLTDWRHYRGFNTGYGAHVSAPYPPRTTVLGGLIDARAYVQIEAIAHRSGGDAEVLTTHGKDAG